MTDDSQLEYENGRSDDRSAERAGAAADEDGNDDRPQDEGVALPLKEGTAFGTTAVIVTYVVHLLLTVIATAQTTPAAEYVGADGDETVVVTELVSSWVAAGWSYLSAFGTTFEAEGEPARLVDAPNHGAAFVSPPFTLSTMFLFFATFGAVVAAGYAVAKYTAAENPVEAVVAGLTVVAPYFVFAVLAAILFTHTYTEGPTVADVVGIDGAANVGGLEREDFLTDDGEATADVEFGPSTASAVFYAGIVLPGLLAAFGGLLAKRREAFERLMTTLRS